MPCELLGLPVSILEKVGELLVGEVDPAGLRGSSVIARELAQALVSKELLPVVSWAWLCLGSQML